MVGEWRPSVVKSGRSRVLCDSWPMAAALPMTSNGSGSLI